jgi:hypothetical protein
LVEGVRNGKQGVEQPPFDMASSTCSYSALENKGRLCRVVKEDERGGGKAGRRTKVKEDEMVNGAQSEHLSMLSGHRARKAVRRPPWGVNKEGGHIVSPRGSGKEQGQGQEAERKEQRVE